MNILKNVPVELKRKIIGYMIRPPHYQAYITGMRPIFDNELYTKIDGEINILSRLDQEWIAFNQDYLEDEELNDDWYDEDYSAHII